MEMYIYINKSLNVEVYMSKTNKYILKIPLLTRLINLHINSIPLMFRSTNLNSK